MLRLSRFVCALCSGLAATMSLASGAAPASGPAAPPTTSRWETTSTLRASLGWRDNVLLSPFAPLERPFARGEAEVFLYRALGDTAEVVSFLNVDLLRYLSPPEETKGDEQWFAHLEGRWKPQRAVRAVLKADAFLEDSVIDLSETELRRFVAPTRAQGAFATGLVRVELPAGFAFEPQVQVKRVDYREFPGDYDAIRGGLRLQWSLRQALTLSANWQEHDRRYAHRSEYTASGRALPGTRLRFRQREGELRAESRWKSGGDWRVSTVLGRLENRDRASGFFDYDQKHVRLGIEWERTAWQWTVEGEARRTDYLGQTVGAGIAPPARMGDFFETRARGQRQLGMLWAVFAEHRWERYRSNEYGFSYRANTVLAGLQRDW
jgi:hypothetical protein